MRTHLQLALLCATVAATPLIGNAQSYQWSPAPIYGGGFVTGSVFSRAQAGNLYIRTDVGGAYRWNESARTWEFLSAKLAKTGWEAISLATPNTNANRVYMVGLGSPGNLLVSDNKGTDWATPIALPAGCNAAGNGDGRGTGERLAIDPNNDSILYFGSQSGGLCRSVDYGKTWSLLRTGKHITFVGIDSLSGTIGKRTKAIYYATGDKDSTTRDTMYRSLDAGKSWSAIAGQPSYSKVGATWIGQQIGFAKNRIWISFRNGLSPSGDRGQLYSLNRGTDSWTAVDPWSLTIGSAMVQGGYNAISVVLSKKSDGNDTLLVGTDGNFAQGNRFFASKDGGANWIDMRPRTNFLNPHNALRISGQWASGSLNPFNAAHAIFTSNMSTSQTTNLTTLFANATNKMDSRVETRGIEMVVVINLLSPLHGLPLYSALGDVSGFRHSNLSAIPTLAEQISNPSSGNTYSLVAAEKAPGVMARTHDYGGASFSTDTGKTWTRLPFAWGLLSKAGCALPSSKQACNSLVPDGSYGRGGTISMSADGRVMTWKFTWTYDTLDANKKSLGKKNREYLFRTLNRGKTWTMLPPHKVLPDASAAAVYYALEAKIGKVHISVDTGRTYHTAKSTLPLTGTATDMISSFHKAGYIAVALGPNGLFLSKDSGNTLTQIGKAVFTSASKISFGAPAPGRTNPTLFVRGLSGTVAGLWRSDDEGATWSSVIGTGMTSMIVAQAGAITADRKVYGRVYLGVHGRGIYAGSLSTSTTLPVSKFAVGAKLVTTGNPLNGVNLFLNNTVTELASATRVEYWNGQNQWLGTATTVSNKFNFLSNKGWDYGAQVSVYAKVYAGNTLLATTAKSAIIMPSHVWNMKAANASNGLIVTYAPDATTGLMSLTITNAAGQAKSYSPTKEGRFRVTNLPSGTYTIVLQQSVNGSKVTRATLAGFQR